MSGHRRTRRFRGRTHPPKPCILIGASLSGCVPPPLRATPLLKCPCFLGFSPRVMSPARLGLLPQDLAIVGWSEREPGEAEDTPQPYVLVFGR
eukprot:scaffold70909_cov32-Tisochrysis_lutea.AAC.2